MIVWDMPAIMAAAGGDGAIADLCLRYAPMHIPPTPATLRVWKCRKAIPAEWLPVVLYGIACRDGAARVASFLVPKPAPEPTP